jgi:hypothetical protein
MPPVPKVGRARRNRSVGARLIDASAPGLKAPTLPGSLFPDGKPLPLTRRYWKTLWASPLSPQWDPADLGSLYRLAAIYDRFLREPSVSLSAEARLIGEQLGLSPVSRRRLDWTIVQPARNGTGEPADSLSPQDESDLRRVLKALE